jgi:cephalosporin-C deacetylase-like acetyl esterase
MQQQPQSRTLLYSLMGDLPPDRPIESRLVSTEERERYTLEKLTLQLNGIEPVPAYFIKPKQGDGPFPAILFNHSHGGNYRLGKDELINGNVYMQDPPYADAFAQQGYAALCIDAWGFGERSGRSESEIFKQMLWSGQVMWGMMVYDNLRAFQFLKSRTDVDPSRIGTLGMSMGSTMAWWTAALETEIKVCVDICCMTDFQSLIDARGLDGHGIYYYVPSLVKHFTTAQINAMIAPRPHLSLVGIHDLLTPSAGFDRIDEELTALYRRMHAPEAWKLLRYPTGHLETAEMREDILDFLLKYL